VDAGARFVTFVPPVAILVLMASFAHAPWGVGRIAGAVLTLVFLGLLTLARVQLGNSFSVTPQAKVLVTRGIYSKIRHPVYVFSAMLVVGLGLYLQFHWLLMLLVVIVPLQIWRAKQEEKVLTESFGDAYAQYKKTTWF
jgi:protein-S-isoprenylcysteine O-methyltransferase Ste14